MQSNIWKEQLKKWKKDLKKLKVSKITEIDDIMDTPIEEKEEKKTKKNKIIDSILKLVILAAIIPVLNAVGDMIGHFVAYGEWNWTFILISVRNLSIPIMINWFKGVYDDTKADYEKVIADNQKQYNIDMQLLKDKHYAELIEKNDETNAWKIKANLAKYEPEDS